MPWTILKNIARRVEKVVRRLLNILVRLILACVYFLLLFPFGIFIRAFSDFLAVKKERLAWVPRPEVKDLGEFLSRQ